MSYNGWSNYETWNFALWYDGAFDDERFEYLDNAEPQYDWEDKKSRAISDYEDFLKNFVDEEAEQLGIRPSMFSDILNANLSEINFREVATSWIDDIYNDWLETQKDKDDDSDYEEEEE
jgi:hypothetical protein